MSVLRLLEESRLNVWVKIVQYTSDRMTKFIGKVHSTTYQMVKTHRGKANKITLSSLSLKKTQKTEVEKYCVSCFQNFSFQINYHSMMKNYGNNCQTNLLKHLLYSSNKVFRLSVKKPFVLQKLVQQICKKLMEYFSLFTQQEEILMGDLPWFFSVLFSCMGTISHFRDKTLVKMDFALLLREFLQYFFVINPSVSMQLYKYEVKSL